MANTYTYSGPGTRWAEGDPTSEDKLNIARINLDHVYEALNTIMDTDAADGVVTGTVSGAVTLTGSTNNQLTTVTGAGAIAGEANLTFDGTTLAVTGAATVSTTLGVTGAAALAAKVVIGKTGTDTQDLVIEQSIDNTGGGLRVYETGGVDWAQIYSSGGQAYFQNQDVNMSLGPNGVAINDGGGNANMTIGLTINQGANDDEAFVIKSTDIATGRTGITETDTVYSLAKFSPTLGGVNCQVMAEDGATTSVYHLQTHGGTADTAKTTAARALIDLYSAEHNGANSVADITADGNVFAIRARVGGGDVCRFLVDEDGDMYSVTTGQTFDDHDDLALVNNYDVIRSDMAEWNVEHEAELVRLGVLGDTVANGGMTNVTQLQRLHNGAIRQLGEQNNALQLELNEMKQQLFLLMEKN
jgi:hypothetical protein